MPFPRPVLIRRTSRRVPPLTSAQSVLARDLRRDVSLLATDIGPRHTGRPERLHLACEMLASALASFGYKVGRQTFTARGVECVNLDASLIGSDPSRPIIVLGAHYDSVPDCPAANDNASAVAAVLA